MDTYGKANVLLQAAAARGFTGRVFVSQVPAGEASLPIRQCWVGGLYPCSPIMGFPGNGEREKGVLSGQEITYTGGQPVPDGRVGLHNRRGVSVPQDEALRILGLKYPWAEKYWRRRGFPKPPPNDCFVFGEDEVQVVSGVRQQRVSPRARRSSPRT